MNWREFVKDNDNQPRARSFRATFAQITPKLQFNRVEVFAQP